MKKTLIVIIALLVTLTIAVTVIAHGSGHPIISFPESDSAIHVQPTYGG